MAKLVFTNLMLPVQVNRKIVENYVQQFLEHISIRNKEAFFDKNLFNEVNKITHYKTKKWTHPGKAVDFLSTSPLFKRLLDQGVTREEFVEMLPHLQVVEKKAGDVIFNDFHNVNIVINGRVLLRYHEEDPLEY